VLSKKIFQHFPEGTEENDNESKLRQVVPNWASEIHKKISTNLVKRKLSKRKHTDVSIYTIMAYVTIPFSFFTLMCRPH
jgi:hypothetical protein